MIEQLYPKSGGVLLHVNSQCSFVNVVKYKKKHAHDTSFPSTRQIVKFRMHNFNCDRMVVKWLEHRAINSRELSLTFASDISTSSEPPPHSTTLTSVKCGQTTPMTDTALEGLPPATDRQGAAIYNFNIA